MTENHAAAAMKGYHLLTLTHRQASLEEIGRLVIPPSEGQSLGDQLASLKARFGWDELLYLATCNRVIFFFYTRKPVDLGVAHQFLAALRPDLHECPPACLALKMSLFEGEMAIGHLHEVAASIDSLVIGEREIFRQLKEAEERCRAWSLTGDHIRLAMRFAIVAAKEVWTNTGIGEKPVSIVSLAVQQMVAAGLRATSRVLLVGAGQTNALVAKFFLKMGVRKVTVFNRTLEKATEISRAFAEGEALPLESLADFRGGFDCLLVCTGASKIIVSTAVFENLKGKEFSPKIVVDLAVPANADRALADRPNTQLIEIEGLKALADANRSHREQEVIAAQSILKRHLKEFKLAHRQRQIERKLDFLPDQMRGIKGRALDVFQKEMVKMDAPTRAVVERMLDYMVDKSIAEQIKTAKKLVRETL